MPHSSNPKARQAINKINRSIRDSNRQVTKLRSSYNKAVDEYNREARAHNARVRANRQRLQTEINRFNSRPAKVTYTVTYRASVQTLVHSFQRVEASYDAGSWSADDELFDMVESETANSVALLNALENPSEDTNENDAELQQTAITSE